MRPAPAPPHVAPHLLHQQQGAGDVGVDHAPPGVRVLVKKGTAEAPPGIGQQRIHRAPLGCGIEPVDAFRPGQVGLHRLDGPGSLPQRGGRLLDLGFVGRDQHVEFVFRQILASSKPMPVEAPVTMANLRPLEAISFSYASGFQDHLDAAVLLVAERLVHLRAALQRHRVGDDEATDRSRLSTMRCSSFGR